MPELWSKTPPPFDAEGWYWAQPRDRGEAKPEPVLWIAGTVFVAGSQKSWDPELWGPRIDPPIAPPVECVGLVDGDGVVRKWVRPNSVAGYPNAKTVRGVFLPLEVCDD